MVSELLDTLEEVEIDISQIDPFPQHTQYGLGQHYLRYARGVSRFDAAIGGLGGCPYSPGATGNVATEDVVHMVEDSGARTGIDLDKLINESGSCRSTAASASPSFGSPNPNCCVIGRKLNFALSHVCDLLIAVASYRLKDLLCVALIRVRLKLLRHVCEKNTGTGAAIGTS